jgi:hypothetical protein
MGQWGTASCSNDECWDNLYAKDIHEMTQEEADNTCLKMYGPDKYRKGDANNDVKHGVVIWILSQGLMVPVIILEEVLKIAQFNAIMENIDGQGWVDVDERKKSADEEVEVIKKAIEKGGQGEERHIMGLMEKMDKFLGEEDDDL